MRAGDVVHPKYPFWAVVLLKQRVENMSVVGQSMNYYGKFSCWWGLAKSCEAPCSIVSIPLQSCLKNTRIISCWSWKHERSFRGWKNPGQMIYLNINFKGSVIRRKLLRLISDYMCNIKGKRVSAEGVRAWNKVILTSGLGGKNWPLPFVR